MNCAPEAPCGLEPLTLKLHNPVEDAQLRKISVSPRPKYLRISNVDYWDENGRELLIEGQFIPGTTYTVRLPPDFKDIYGQTLPGGLSRAAVVAPRATMALSARTGTLPVGKQQTVGVESRHITAVRVRVGVYTDAELRAVPLAPGDLDKLAFPAAVHERTLPLTPTGKADWASLTLDLGTDETVTRVGMVPGYAKYGPRADVDCAYTSNFERCLLYTSPSPRD